MKANETNVATSTAIIAGKVFHYPAGGKKNTAPAGQKPAKTVEQQTRQAGLSTRH